MIQNALPSGIVNFLSEIESLGFSLCLVGGIPRDYFHSNIIGNDFDFEIRPSSRVDLSDWENYYKKLLNYFLQKKLVFTEYPYLITQVNFEGYAFEFSSPRLETNIPKNLTHHHFEAVLDPGLSYEESFKRRDFTINAIGIELNFFQKREKVIDPYSGLLHLKTKTLKNITTDFFLDSVRFLRLVRFQVKFSDFKIDQGLVDQLINFNLSKLSVHHFKSELKKCGISAFLNKFNELVLDKKMDIPAEFVFLTKYKYPEQIKNPEELLAFIYLEEPNAADLVVKLFSLPEKKLKDLQSFIFSYRLISGIDKIEFSNLAHKSFEEVLVFPVLKELKNLEDKKAWNWVRNFDKSFQKLLIDWSDWEKIVVSSEELNKLDPAIRSYYRYYLALKQKFTQ